MSRHSVPLLLRSRQITKLLGQSLRDSGKFVRCLGDSFRRPSPGVIEPVAFHQVRNQPLITSCGPRFPFQNRKRFLIAVRAIQRGDKPIGDLISLIIARVSLVIVFVFRHTTPFFSARRQTPRQVVSDERPVSRLIPSVQDSIRCIADHVVVILELRVDGEEQLLCRRPFCFGDGVKDNREASPKFHGRVSFIM